ncbi:MAG: hypothetical protein J0H43_07350 [Actinobacteria bacterium]|nr:hypothetical protein [Actinomycetota bacterium]
MNRRPTDDRGTLSLEYVILVPIIFIVLALIYVFARMSQVDGLLDAGTRDAARAASLAANAQQAHDIAVQIIKNEVAGSSATCARTLQVDPLPPFVPPEPSQLDEPVLPQVITIRATCQYPIADAGLPGAPGTLTVHSQFSTAIAPNRSLG